MNQRQSTSDDNCELLPVESEILKQFPVVDAIVADSSIDFFSIYLLFPESDPVKKLPNIGVEVSVVTQNINKIINAPYIQRN